MDEEKHLNRVRESADVVVTLLSSPSNVPLHDYIELEDARALAFAMSIDPKDMTIDDLERLLMIRDGLYNLVTDANERGADGEHSVEMLLNSLSRLYVDLESALRSKGGALEVASNRLSKLQDTPRAIITGQEDAIEKVKAEANSVISQTNITNRTVNINILNFDVGKVDLLRNLKIDIQRLSASVFAIKMQFEAGILFEGTIRFLNEGADRILKDIGAFASQLSDAYRSAKELTASIAPLIEKGTRFVKLIGSYITGFFDNPQSSTLSDYRFSLRGGYKSAAITSAVSLENGPIIFGGRLGTLITANPSSGQVVPQKARLRSDIRCLGDLGNGDIALGTEDGLAILSALTSTPPLRASYNERVAALAIAHWGGLGSAIVTGAMDGALRRWTLSGGLSQLRTDVTNREASHRLARSIQSIMEWNGRVLVAAGESLYLLDPQFEIEEQVQIDRKILGMCRFTPDTVVVVGSGFVAEVNLARGTFSRMLTVSAKSEYVAVAPLENGVVAAGTSEGRVRAIDIKSGTELGELDLDMVLRGLIVRDGSLFAYGGGWKSSGKSMVHLSWKRAS